MKLPVLFILLLAVTAGCDKDPTCGSLVVNNPPDNCTACNDPDSRNETPHQVSCGGGGGGANVTITSVSSGAETAAARGAAVFIQHKPGNDCSVSIGTNSDPDPAISYATGSGNISASVNCAADNTLPSVKVVGTDWEYTSDLCSSEEISFPKSHELKFYILDGKDLLTGKPWVKFELVQTGGPSVDLSSALSNSEGKGSSDIFSKVVSLPVPGEYEFTLNAIDTRTGAAIAPPAILGTQVNTNKVLVCQSAAAQLPEVHAVNPEEGSEPNHVIVVQGTVATDGIPLEGSAVPAAGSVATQWLAPADINILAPSSLATSATFARKTGFVLLAGVEGAYKKTDMVKYVFPEGEGNDAVIDIAVAGSGCTANPPAGPFMVKPGPEAVLNATAAGNVAGRMLKYGNINEYTAGNTPLALSINEEGRGKLIWVCPATSQKALAVHRAGPGHVGFGFMGELPTDENIRLYNNGAQVTLSAFPENGYSFSGWEGFGGSAGGAISSSSNPMTVTLNTNTYLAAKFTKNAVSAGIVKMNPDLSDPDRIVFSSIVNLGANVPDLVSPYGVVDELDEERFSKCIGGPGNQPFGANLLDPGAYGSDLDYCYQSDFDGDGDVDDNDTKIMKTCLNDSDNPAPGFTCFGGGSQPASDFEVQVLKDGIEVDQFTGHAGDTYPPAGQTLAEPGLYTIKTTVGSITRTVQVKLPVRVTLDLGRAEDGYVETNEGSISVTASGGLPVGCPATVQDTPSICEYPAGTQVQLTAVPGTGYRFVGWQVEQAPGSVPGLTDPLDPSVPLNPATISLDWVDGGAPYVITALMTEGSEGT